MSPSAYDFRRLLPSVTIHSTSSSRQFVQGMPLSTTSHLTFRERQQWQAFEALRLTVLPLEGKPAAEAFLLDWLGADEVVEVAGMAARESTSVEGLEGCDYVCVEIQVRTGDSLSRRHQAFESQGKPGRRSRRIGRGAKEIGEGILGKYEKKTWARVPKSTLAPRRSRMARQGQPVSKGLGHTPDYPGKDEQDLLLDIVIGSKRVE